MQVTEKVADGLSRTYEVTLPAAQLHEKLNAKIEEIQPQVRLKGFRPGKVPASHIRKMFGADMLKEIIEEEVKATSEKALSDREIRPAAFPEIKLDADPEAVAKTNADVTYEMFVEVMPDFEPTDLKALTVTRPVAEVSDEDVQTALDSLAEQQKTYEPRRKGSKAKDGDMLLANYVGKIDGEAFEGGSAEGADIVLGAGRLIPGFEEQLVGAKAGEEVTVTVTFPEDYPRADLAAKEAVFEVAVEEVKAPKTPEIDDDLATALGLESLDKLKEAIKGNLERDFAAQSRQRVKRRVLDALDGAHQFDLPERMVDTEFDQIWRHVEEDLKNDRLDEADKDKSEDELREEYKAIAVRRVRLGLVLAEIGRDVGIEVKSEEVARAINAEARRYPGQEAEVARFYRDNAQAQAQLRAPIFEEKVVDYILELATVEDETVDREALFADDDEAA